MLKEAQKQGVSPELIGQFGVGFYSSFIVAERVELITRSVNEKGAWRWESTGDGTYTISRSRRTFPGTTVILHLKPADDDEDPAEYLDKWKIREIVKKYSDFVSYPIKMKKEPPSDVEAAKDPGDDVLNSMKAIWTRPEDEVTEEEYNEFYKHVSRDWTDPLKRISYLAEGTTEFRALLYIPAVPPMNLMFRDAPHGINLYVKRVFIMNDCEELIPEYLRFVKGVVDSEDLSLNISREILQQDRGVRRIRQGLVRKLLSTLGEMLKDEREDYEKFWTGLGRVLKEGLFQDQKNQEKLLGLSLFRSSEKNGEWVSLEDYLGRMKVDQKGIYFMTGDSLETIQNSPHLEGFRDKGIEVLLMTDPVDAVWTTTIFDYKETPFKAVGRGEIELEEDDKDKLEEEKNRYSSLLEVLRAKLQDEVKEVRLSSRLTTSPACLVGDEGDISPQMAELLKQAGQEIPHVKRILEVNPDHPVLKKLNEVFERDSASEMLGEFAELLYGQAVLAEGGELKDPSAFSKRLSDLMLKAL
jgi:molecular chaperone HtpG